MLASCELRAGLAVDGALELTVGTFDTAARLPATTRVEAETWGPPGDGWLFDEAAPEVAWRDRLEEAAAKALGLLLDAPELAAAADAAEFETAGGAFAVLRLATAERTACDTSGVASPALARFARADVEAVGAAGARALLGRPSAMATSGAVAAWRRIDEAVAEISAVCPVDGFAVACATAAAVAATGLRVVAWRATLPELAFATSVGAWTADLRAVWAAACTAGAAAGADSAGCVWLVAAACVRPMAALAACVVGLGSELGAGEGAAVWATVAASGRLVVRAL